MGEKTPPRTKLQTTNKNSNTVSMKSIYEHEFSFFFLLGNRAYGSNKNGQTSSGIGFKFSFMYPTEGGINALLFPENKPCTNKFGHVENNIEGEES